MKGQLPAAESRPLSETIATTDIDQMLHEYVKPAFLRMSGSQRQQVLDLIKQIESGKGE